MNDFLKAMLHAAEQAMQHAYTPYSHFPVGACIRTTEHQLFVGCNVENASFPLSICAESAAIAQMICAGYHVISDVLIVAQQKACCPPCGGCRQRLIEFATPETNVHLCDVGVGVKKTLRLVELLPETFHLK